MKYLILISLFLSLNAAVYAQNEGYKIQVKLNNSSDTSLLLVSYYGNTNQIADTAFLKNGSYIFTGDKALGGGIYLVVFQNKQYFELVIDKEQHFSIQTDPADPINQMIIKNSKDNLAFYSYLKNINSLGKKDQELNQKYKDLEGEKEKQAQLKIEIDTLTAQIKKTKQDFIDLQAESLFAKILMASKEPEIPTVLPLKDDGTPDSAYIYKYYKMHYFDDFDFADERLLRTPIYANKIKRYFKNVLIQNPDTLIKESIAIIEKSKPNKETYKYTIWYFTYESETSQIMGMDEVFVALGKKYYVTGEAYWTNEIVLERMKKRINTLDRLLIGNQAPNLVMQDTAFKLQSLHAVNAKYTMVVFWDPDCGHCKHEISDLISWYNEDASKYDVKIFAVCADTNMVKMTKKIHEYKIKAWINVDGPRSLTENYHELYDIISTPTIYLLDEQKNIIAKRLNAKQNIDFIKRDYDLKMKK